MTPQERAERIAALVAEAPDLTPEQARILLALRATEGER